MAKKKKPGKKSPPSAVPGEMQSIPLDLPLGLEGFSPQMLDRAMRKALAQQLGLDAGPDPNSPAGQAQKLIDRALNAPEGKQLSWAQKALAVDPDCVEAHLIIGDYAKTAKEAIQHYEAALAAGRRVLGSQFDEMQGEMWMHLAGRPYMRALEALAHALRSCERHGEALDCYREMLRLNDGDNQGARYLLLDGLLLANLNEEAEALLEKYDEDTATWHYSRLLLLFRRHGESPECLEGLRIAQKSNKHVLDFLLSKKMLPETLPGYIEPGKSSEAVDYCAGNLAVWKTTPGAISWLRDAIEKLPSKKKSKTSQGKSGKLKIPEATPEQLLALPQEPELVWEFDTRRMATWVESNGRPRRPWMCVVVESTQAKSIGHEVTVEAPTADDMWRCLSRGMFKPLMNDGACRPGTVQLCQGENFEFLRARLDAIGVRCEMRDDLPAIDYLFEQLLNMPVDEDQPALLDIPGIADDDLEAYYDAAALYYRRAPWRRVQGDTILEVKCPEVFEQPMYAVVMGQSGIEIGIALYRDLAFLRKMVSGRISPHEVDKLTDGMPVLFGEDYVMSARDVDAIERHGWNVASPEAYPQAMRVSAGPSFSLPTLLELKTLVVALLAVPQFLADRKEAVEIPLGEQTQTATIREIK